jgi:hypothetical protein
VVRDCSAVSRGRLGGTNVHAAIDLHGIDGDDLDICASGCERHRHITLSRRCWPEDYER